MRILAITHQFPTPFQPTYSTYNRQQFAALAMEHELLVIRPIPWTLALTQRRQGKWQGPGPISQAGIATLFPVFYYPPKLGEHRYGQFFAWSIQRAFSRACRGFQPDVILASWAHPDGWAAARLARQAALPVVVKVTGADVLVYASGRRRPFVAEALKSVDAVVAVSRHLASQVIALGVSPGRVHVIPEGVSAELFAPGDQRSARERLALPAEARLLVFAGSLLASKGALDLIRACALLRDRGLAFTCRLVGGGADAPRVAALIQECGLGDRVTCVGVRPHEELADWYRASDLVVLPSHVEGLPNVLREALACGRPFVATTVGGIPEIADPSFSRLVAPGDVASLASALEQMLAAPPSVDPALVAQRNVTWQQSANQLTTRMQAVIDERARG